MAGKTGLSEITVLLNGKQAERVAQSLTEDLERLIQRRDELNSKGILDLDEIAKLNQLGKDIKQKERDIKSLRRQLVDVGDTIRNIAHMSENDLSRAMKQLIRETKNLDRSTQEYADKRKQIALLRSELNKINNTGQKAAGTFDVIGKTMKRLASYVLVYMGFNELVSGMRSLIQVNAELSDQLADIEKTTGITGKSLRELAADIRSIDTRTSVKDLNNLAYTAGKLGITGKDNILGFVNAANQINVALGEDLGDDAIKNIAKLNDVLGITKQLGVEQSLLATGSAINELGQTSTASEGYLVDFAQRLGGIAAQAGISVQQILALASASDQTGQNVEVAATAINKLVTTLLSKTDQVAKAIGATSEELRSALSESTWKGLMLVFEKLSGKGGLAAIAPLMGDLGSDGARLNAVISALTSNTDLLSTALQTSNKAFSEAKSLTAETMKKEESLLGIWERAKKNITQSFQSSQITQSLKDLAVYVYRTTSEFDEFGNRIGGAANALVILGQWLMKLFVFLVKNIDILAALTSGNVAFKASVHASELATKSWALVTTSCTAVAKSAHAFTLLLSAGMALLTGNTTKATASMAAFRAISLATPWGIALGALTAIGAAIYTIYRRTTEASREMAAFRKELNQNIAAEQSEATFLFTAAMKAKEGTDERRKAIEELNNKYKEYLPNILNEKTSTDELRIALEKVNTALKENIAARMKQKEIEDAMRQSLTSQMNIYDKIRESSDNTASMDEKIIASVKELAETYSGLGKDATETYLIISEALKSEFGTLVNQGKDYWSSIYKYVNETISLRDKLKNIDNRYAPFEPKDNQTSNNVLPEVIVTAPYIPKGTESDEDKKKRLKSSLDIVDAYIDAEKSKLIQARINRQKYRDEDIDSEQKYLQMLEKIEFEGLQKKMEIQGLSPEKRAEVERQFYDFKLKLFNKEEQDTNSFLKKLDELYDQFDLKSVQRDERELVRIQQKYNDATLLLENALKKGLISQENYKKQVDLLREKEKEAEEEYYKQKASKEAQSVLKRLDQEQSEDELAASEMRVNGLYTEQEYKARLLQIELEYQEKRLAVAGLTEEQITALKQKNADRQIAILDQASRKQEQIQSQYNALIKSSLTNVGEAFGELFSGEEDAMKAFGESMIDIMFNVLDQLVTIWTTEMAASAVKTTFKATAESYATPDSVLSFGASGAARAAVMAGLISAALAVAKAGIKAAIKGGSPSSSSGSTGQRVVKTSGFDVGGYTGDGGTYEVAGLVHKGEYVVPKWLMQLPHSRMLVNNIEYIRQTQTSRNPLPRGLYADGGGVETNITPVAPSGIYADPQLQQTLNGILNLLDKLNTNGIQAQSVISLSNLEKQQERRRQSIDRGSLKKKS